MPILSGARALGIGALVACIGTGGCGSSPSAPLPMTPAADSVSRVANMNPPAGTALQMGQTVTFSGTPAYTLASADLGTMFMAVRDQANQPLPVSGAQPVVVVRRGTGDVTLTETVIVPAVGVTAVRVFFVLAPAGASSTTTSDVVSYPTR